MILLMLYAKIYNASRCFIHSTNKELVVVATLSKFLTRKQFSFSKAPLEASSLMMTSIRKRITWILSLSLIYPPLVLSKCTNEYEKDTGSLGEDIWRSKPSSCFIPQHSQSYGTIRVGKEMSMTFDFTRWG